MFVIHMTSVFDFQSYKVYLRAYTGGPGRRSGIKSALATAIRCQTTYFSRVLNGNAQLSLEQAEALSLFLKHTDDEAHYFLLLVQKERAGTRSLHQYFQKQIDQILAKRMVLRERIAGELVLNKADQAEYYSSWHYAAFHIAVTVPALRNREALSRYFRVPSQRVHLVMEFLIRAGMVSELSGIYFPVQVDIMLGNDSPNIIRHHTNWRNRAIDSLETERPEEMHYSAVVSVAREDLPRIKENLVQLIQKNLALYRASKEEEIYCCSIDFFGLGR